MEKTQVNIKKNNTEHENELKISSSWKTEVMNVLGGRRRTKLSENGKMSRNHISN